MPNEGYNFLTPTKGLFQCLHYHNWGFLLKQLHTKILHIFESNKQFLISLFQSIGTVILIFIYFNLTLILLPIIYLLGVKNFNIKMSNILGNNNKYEEEEFKKKFPNLFKLFDDKENNHPGQVMTSPISPEGSKDVLNEDTYMDEGILYR